MSEQENRSPVFVTTHWSLVAAAADPTQFAAAREALEKLCRAYWFPVYGYVRSKGFSIHDAEDLTQEFFTRFIQSDALRSVSRDRGRFRAFLLASLNHFLSNEWDRLRAEKRGGGKPILSLDIASAEERLQMEPSTNVTPETLYQRRWALTLLDTVVGRLRDEMAQAGKGQSFQALCGFLADARGAVSYEEAAAELGMTEVAVRKVVQRLRQRYRELLREEVAQTVASPAEVLEELNYLLNTFTG